MRKDVLRSIRQQFGSLISSRLNDFKKVSEFRGFAGSDLYVWRLSDLSYYVLLFPSPKSYRDSFMVELARSRGSFPERAPLQTLHGLNTTADGRIRLPQLWREQWPSALEPWWVVGDSLSQENVDEFYSAEETSRRVAATAKAVEDAIAKIQHYAIPFFRQIGPGYSSNGPSNSR